MLRLLAALPLVLLLLAADTKPTDNKQADKADWQKEEAKYLHNIKQITPDDHFGRAREAHLPPDAKDIIFQAEEKGAENPFYQIYTMNLETKKFRRVSPGVGKT